MGFPKSLIIGLGGIGSDIVSRVYSRFMNSNPSDNEKAKVGFLCFDTDKNDIDLRREVMSKDYVIQTSASTNMTIADYLEKISERSTVEEWFDTGHNLLNQMTLNDGAGQIRMASRLAMNLAIDENKLDIIGNIINRILSSKAEKDEGNDIRVHIICSIAGGTGAGSFMQISYYIKEILRNQKGLSKPRITGYFLMADILCQDPETQFDAAKRENTLANSYASLKELNGIYNYDRSGNGFNIDFEYRFFNDDGKGHPLPDSEPFETSYLYDFDDSKGENRGKKENYYNQIEDYVYLNVLSPVGAKTRSAAINDILSSIKTGGVNRYASAGVSKIVYPINDIIQLFSTQRVVDNLSLSWLKIDQSFNKLLLEHKRQLNLGVIADRPKLSRYFRDNVETFAKNGNGAEKIVFLKIYNSVQIFDKNNFNTGSKASHFMREFLAYLKRSKENKKSLNEQTERIHLPSNFSQENDPENDGNVIAINETQLRSLQKEVLSFIENTKAIGIEEALLADYQEKNFLTRSPSRMNTYLLKNDDVMEPLAIRYFFYELQEILERKYEALKEENLKLWENIEGYKVYFDIKDDQDKNDVIETAAEAYEIYRRKDDRLISRLGKVFGVSGSLNEFKEKYVARTRRQITHLNDYAVSKLQEEVILGVKAQVDQFIEELERLFNNLEDVRKALVRQTEGLKNLHKENSDKTTQWVLGDPEIKEKFYQDRIALHDYLEFPQDLSALIYKSLYKKLFQAVYKRSAQMTDDFSIFNIFSKDVISKQTHKFKEDFKDDFAGYNVIRAIRFEAELKDKPEKELLKMYFREAVKLSNPLGAKTINKASRINSWALNPDCLDSSTLSQEEADELMGSLNVNADEGAYRVSNHFFSKYEIIRENSAFLLSVPDNYPQFSSGRKKNKYSTSSPGKYYEAYKKRIDEVDKGSSVSPHLDKRWHFPGYFPDLGESREVVAEKIYRSFFWGLVNGDLLLIEEDGNKRWRFYKASNQTTRVINNEDQKPIRPTISDLIFKGLFANPGIVDSILEKAERIIEDSKTDFQDKFNANKVSALMTLQIFKDISAFRFSMINGLKEKTFFSVFEKLNLTDKEIIFGIILQTFVATCIFIAGNNNNTHKATKKMLSELIGENKDVLKIVDTFLKHQFSDSISSE